MTHLHIKAWESLLLNSIFYLGYTLESCTEFFKKIIHISVFYSIFALKPGVIVVLFSAHSSPQITHKQYSWHFSRKHISGSRKAEWITLNRNTSFCSKAVKDIFLPMHSPVVHHIPFRVPTANNLGWQNCRWNLVFLHTRNCLFAYCLPSPEFSWCSSITKVSDCIP